MKNRAYLSRLVLLSTILLVASLSARPLISVGLSEKSPVLDGKADECYKNALPVTNFVLPVSLKYSQEDTVVKFIRDKSHLYIFADCQQKDMSNAAKSMVSRDDGHIWKTDSIEVFFEDGNELKQIIINSIGSIYDAKYIADEAQKYRNDKSFNYSVEAKALQRADGYSLEIRIPLSELPASPLRFNLVRNNYSINEYSSFTPFNTFNWQQPEEFAEMLFIDQVPGFDYIKKPETGKNETLQLEVYSPLKFLLNQQEHSLAAGKATLEYSAEKVLACEIVQAGKSIYSWQYQKPDRYLQLLPTSKCLYLDANGIFNARISWDSKHNFPDGNKAAGEQIALPFEIVVEVPDGINVLRAAKDSGKKGRYIQKEKNAYNAPHWISTQFASSLPENSEGEIKCFVRWDGGQTEPYSFPFKVLRIPKVAAPKKFLTAYYASWVNNLSAAKALGAMGINTIPVRDYSQNSVQLAKTFKKEGFFVQRGSYFWPGDTQHRGGTGYLKWTKQDRSARSRDIAGFYIPIGDSFQLSPSYRGKYFQEAIQKEVDFCKEAGINYFAFDLESYIQPRGELGDFHERTVALFKEYWQKKHPDKEYLEPQVFEKEAEKHPFYHSAWVEFKCELWADFFIEMKKGLAEGLAGVKSSPYDGVFFTDWIIGNVWDEEGRNKVMRNASWFTAFDMIELDNYSSLDRDLRNINKSLANMQRVFPEVDFKWIFVPAPRRLESKYYKTTAPPLENEFKYGVMEAAGFGAKGVIAWHYATADVETMKQFAEGIEIINRCEDIVLNGKRVKNISCNFPADLAVEDYFRGVKSTWENEDRVFVKALEHDDKTLVCVSEYREQKLLQVEVNYLIKRNVTVRDLESDQLIGSLAAGSKSFTVTLEADKRCKLLLLETKQEK